MPPDYWDAPVKWLLGNLTMVPLLFRISPAIFVYWTLLLEMLFYVVVSAMFARGLQALAPFAAVCTLSIALAGGGMAIATGSLGLAFASEFVFDFAMLFVGVVMYRMHNRRLPVRRSTTFARNCTAHRSRITPRRRSCSRAVRCCGSRARGGSTRDATAF